MLKKMVVPGHICTYFIHNEALFGHGVQAEVLESIIMPEVVNGACSLRLQLSIDVFPETKAHQVGKNLEITNFGIFLIRTISETSWGALVSFKPKASQI